MRIVKSMMVPDSLSKSGLRGLSWPLILCCIAIIFIAVSGNRLFADGDSYWHIAAAKWMVENLQVLDHDVFSHTMPGARWHSHEWLSALILYSAFQAGSWTGVLVLTALAYAAALGLIGRYVMNRLEPAYAILLAVFGGASIASHLQARPHALVLPIVVFWAISCIKASENQTTPSWLLAPTMAIWTNMHGSFVLGLGLVVIFGCESLMKAGQARERTRVLKAWALFGGVIFLFSLVSPHGIQGILFPIKMNQMPFMLDFISEWRSPNFQRVTIQEIWILVMLAFAIMRGIRIPPVRAVLLLLLTHMALKHVRHIDYLGALVPLLIATPLAAALKTDEPERSNAAVADHFFARGVPQASPLMSIVALMFSLLLGLTLALKPLVPSQKIAPADAVAAARRLGLSGNVFNSYVFGGYLIYSDIPTFIDGRADMYGDGFLRKTIEAYGAYPAKLLPLLEQYKVSWTLLAPDTAAISVLDASQGWKCVYADDYAVIHQRIDPFAVE